MLKRLLFLIFCLSAVASLSNFAKSLRRQRRFLTSPMHLPSRLQWVAGVGLPVILDDESITLGSVLKAQYDLAHNSSAYTNLSIDWTPNDGIRPYWTVKRSIPDPVKPRITRWHLYKGVEALANSYGMVGRICMLRAICEAAENPFTHENGILGELMHVILTPSTSDEAIGDHEDNEYLKAERIGKEAQNDHENGHEHCAQVFDECDTPLLQMFTSVEYLYKKIL